MADIRFNCNGCGTAFTQSIIVMGLAVASLGVMPETGKPPLIDHSLNKERKVEYRLKLRAARQQAMNLSPRRIIEDKLTQVEESFQKDRDESKERRKKRSRQQRVSAQTRKKDRKSNRHMRDSHNEERSRVGQARKLLVRTERAGVLCNQVSVHVQFGQGKKAAMACRSGWSSMLKSWGELGSSPEMPYRNEVSAFCYSVIDLHLVGIEAASATKPKMVSALMLARDSDLRKWHSLLGSSTVTTTRTRNATTFQKKVADIWGAIDWNLETNYSELRVAQYWLQLGTVGKTRPSKQHVEALQIINARLADKSVQ